MPSESDPIWRRILKCHCGATAEVDQGSVFDESDQSGFYPVYHFGGDIRWFCPIHTKEVREAVIALGVACGGDVEGILPPMLQKMTKKFT